MTLLLAVATLALQVQSLPMSGCTIEQKPDGSFIFQCIRDPEGSTTQVRRLYAVCATEVVGVPTILTIYPDDSELLLLDKANTAISASLYALPTAWQVLKPATLSRSVWEALPATQQWGAVRSLFLVNNTRVGVSGACMKALLAILNLKPEEPY